VQHAPNQELFPGNQGTTLVDSQVFCIVPHICLTLDVCLTRSFISCRYGLGEHNLASLSCSCFGYIHCERTLQYLYACQNTDKSPCSLQALGLAVLLAFATSLTHATFIEDASIADKKGAIGVFAALLANRNCTEDTSGCPTAFAIKPDPDDVHCFIACSSVAGSCRACCLDGLYYNPPTQYAKLGSCSRVSPYATLLLNNLCMLWLHPTMGH
jgi:hypothetical protein